MFIQTEVTPNPATLKFLPGRNVLENGTLDLPSRDSAAQSPLAARLFDIPNVGGVFFGSDFISVTKTDGDWQQMKPAILGAIMEHYMSGAPLLTGDANPSEAAADEFFDAKDAETVATIGSDRNPCASSRGRRRRRHNLVVARKASCTNAKGACSGCPSSTATLSTASRTCCVTVPDVVEVRPM
jgi:hypothetical protein